jgi:hypothetical protein
MPGKENCGLFPGGQSKCEVAVREGGDFLFKGDSWESPEIPEESVEYFLRALLRERSDYGQRCPGLSKVSEEFFKN